jgi:rubredoxin/uncharacterized membrane protein
MKKWECSVCGYIHEGEEPPEKCPVCGAGKAKFFEINASEETASQVTQESDAQVVKGAEGLSAAEHSGDESTMFAKISRLILENHLHPISVHTPNGIIPVAVVFLVLAVLLNVSSLESAAYYNIIFVLLSMPVVILSGYITWQKKYNGAKTSVFKIKIAASCIVTAILFVLIGWKTVQPDVLSSASSGRWVFLALSLILLAVVGLAGHLGGQLVFANKK